VRPGDVVVAVRTFSLWETSNLLDGLYDDGGAFGYDGARATVERGRRLVVLETLEKPMGFGDRRDWSRVTAVRVLSPSGVGWTSDDNLTSP
jgi:hypothetical protein